MKKIVLAATAALAFVLSAAPASAAYVINVYQSGANVVASGSGSLNISGLTMNNSPTSGNGWVFPSGAYMKVGSGMSVLAQGVGITGPSNYGTSPLSLVNADINTGAIVGINMQAAPAQTRFIFVPQGYVSGANLGMSTSTYNNKTLSGLGLTAGNSYTWTWAADSFTINVLSTAPGVPEPATWLMMIAGFAAMGAALRHRRNPLVAAA